MFRNVSGGLGEPLPVSVCFRCGLVMPRCECEPCSICGSKAHPEERCPNRPGDAVVVDEIPLAA